MILVNARDTKSSTHVTPLAGWITIDLRFGKVELDLLPILVYKPAP